MVKHFKKAASLIIISLIISFHSMGWAWQKLRVVTSIFPLQEFAKAIGNERINVKLLIPPGIEPHTWRPRPADIVNLTNADIFIYIGAVMEPWVKDLLEGAKSDSLVIIEASDGIYLIHPGRLGMNHLLKETEQNNNLPVKDLTHHSHGRMDPHIWLDFQNDQKIIDKIVKVFSQKDPEWTEIYMENGKRYKERLAELDRKYAQGLKNCKRSEILIGGHATFSYIASKYGLKQVPLYGLSPDAKPRPREMAEIIDFAKRHSVKAVFFEKLVNDHLARVIAEEIGAVTLVLNPGPNLTKEERERGITFISIMEDNLRNLMEGLGCE